MTTVTTINCATPKTEEGESIASMAAKLEKPQSSVMAEAKTDEKPADAKAKAAIEKIKQSANKTRGEIPEFLARPAPSKEEAAKVTAKHGATTVNRSVTMPKTNPAEKPKPKGKTTIGSVASEAILAGDTNEQALAKVMKAFPTCNSNLSCMSWYRNQLRKAGKLGTTGKPTEQKTNAPKAKAGGKKTGAKAPVVPIGSAKKKAPAKTASKTAGKKTATVVKLGKFDGTWKKDDVPPTKAGG